MVSIRVRNPDIGNADSKQAEQSGAHEAAHHRLFTCESLYWAASVTTAVRQQTQFNPEAKMVHLVEMSIDDFHGLPQLLVPRTVRMRDSSLTSQDALDWIFIGYCRKLIEKNEPLANLLDLHRCDLDDDDFLSNTTKGQRLLLHLAALDGQTQNGGITQFIWNRPEMVLPTLDALETLNYPELLTSYRNIVDRLGIDPDEWTRLRNSNHTDSSKYWDDFAAAAQLINGDEFDNPYFDHVGDNARRMAIQYVNANTHEFIAQQ